LSYKQGEVIQAVVLHIGRN